MGVPGLWEILRPAGETRSLTHLAVADGFVANPDGCRGLRIGIDASIWFYHATYGREGENPELRTLFFRCTRLLSAPFLPLFVFDGPKRPAHKRGKRISGKDHWMVQGMQAIISAFGFEWRMAPGEAEAELAYLNRIGAIDAVYTDDVDTFLFGAKMIVRNAGTNLTGNRAHALTNSDGRDDGNHVAIYKAADVLAHPSIGLTQGGLILIGILRGGDYDQAGLPGCGPAIAHGLARAGLGDALLHAARTTPRSELPDALAAWREALRAELRTNSQGHLGGRRPALAHAVRDDFPAVDVLLSYACPVTSETCGGARQDIRWDKEPDLGKIAGVCEMYFEWGVKDIILKRFRTVLWPAAVLRILRRAVLLQDRARDASTSSSSARPPVTPGYTASADTARRVPGTPASMIAAHFSSMHLTAPSPADADADAEPLLTKIHSARTHASTDGVPELRVEIAPAQLAALCAAGVEGRRKPVEHGLFALPASDGESGGEGEDGEDGGEGRRRGRAPPDPASHLRVWLPACMVRPVEPALVAAFEDAQAARAARRAGTKSASASKKKPAAKGKGKGSRRVPAIEEEEEESADEMVLPVAPIMPTKKKSAPTNTKVNEKMGKKKGTDPKRAFEASPSPASRIKDFYATSKSSSAAAAKSRGLPMQYSSPPPALRPPSSPPRAPRPLAKAVAGPSRRARRDSTISISDGSDDALFRAAPPVRTLSTPIPALPVRVPPSSQRGDNVPAAPPPQPKPKPRLVPAPFPLSRDDYAFPSTHSDSDTGDMPRGIPRVPGEPTKTRTCEDHGYSSDSSLQKSPRTSRAQTSPRSKTRELPSEDESALDSRDGARTDERRPPAVPVVRPLLSPARRRAAAIKENVPVIEISSDSDDASLLATKRDIPPLLLAKARSTNAATHTSNTMRTLAGTSKVTLSKSRRNTPLPDPDDIIDLT
ncbi:hypothetical protein WOLCODRAFT_164194 [Wolfiporia cocos MD-104 SS10]|uniref:XPG-I domain-containing protein n=1 Tax=Wolfiporia cocos (strain MD-104) TaxID=742152 RepID=A0A2H3JLG6_WOLCO|nr:hypothetical protein WOLCODRAFT_164194 [Wolfiporia cocos MD-104 SS10]